MTQRLGRERGRPFYLSVRVATTLEACRRIGYDLKTWVREDLCDMMAAGGGAGTDYGVEVEAFLDLLKGTGIRFYPGFDSGFWGAHQGLKPHRQWHEAMVRAAASRLLGTRGRWNLLLQLARQREDPPPAADYRGITPDPQGNRQGLRHPAPLHRRLAFQ